MCKCDKDKKNVNCANHNLNQLFSAEQWTALAKDNGDALESVVYVKITNLFPSPLICYER